MTHEELMAKLPCIRVIVPGNSYLWNSKLNGMDILYVPNGGYTRSGIDFALDYARYCKVPIAYNSRQLEIAIDKYLKDEDFEVRIG